MNVPGIILISVSLLVATPSFAGSYGEDVSRDFELGAPAQLSRLPKWYSGNCHQEGGGVSTLKDSAGVLYKKEVNGSEKTLFFFDLEAFPRDYSPLSASQKEELDETMTWLAPQMTAPTVENGSLVYYIEEDGHKSYRIAIREFNGALVMKYAWRMSETIDYDFIFCRFEGGGES